jgi:hypothetical protein
MDFPLIYCNGDSYTDETYHPTLRGNTYVNFVANELNGFAINAAISGSCNRRIIRTTLHDVITQRHLNPTQKIIALIGLSFELRSEIWIDDIENTRSAEESNFRTHTFSKQLNWRENLLADHSVDSLNPHKQNEKFFKKFSEGRAFFFSPYAERINLLADLVMLRSLFESLNIEFLVFQSPRAEKLESDYLLDFFKKQIFDDERFIDFETFGFADWCHKQNFTTIDPIDMFPPAIAHYGPDAHEAFAKQIIIPKLQELSII